MMLVIISGALGIWAYATLPQRLHGNRGETTRKQMIESIESLDRQMQITAFLEGWLFVHIPATFALLAALTAHIVSVFTYW
jgi:hypothetical protein